MPDMASHMEHSDRPESPVTGRPLSRTTNREPIYNPYFTGRPRTPVGGHKTETMDRQEIIRKIKEKGVARQVSLDAPVDLSKESASGWDRRGMEEPALLPSPAFDVESESSNNEFVDRMSHGLEISRPRSALHRGDFRGDESRDTNPNFPDSPRPMPHFSQSDFAASSPPAPWHDGFPNTSIHRTRRNQGSSLQTAFAERARPRAVSGASLSHSFSYQAPTSPLVNQSNAEDMADDFSLPSRSYLNDRSIRRRTFSPTTLQGFGSYGDARHTNFWHSSPPSLRRESTVPYQAHQPRRSITSLGSLPQTPQLSSRRSSGLGSSPLQHSMVGSFEESILRGRMSTAPSRPLDFTAHIGVLGRGDCRPSLKCPPHITVPFPAVFYNYGHSKNNHDSQPSPYVGLVDLENAPVTNDSRFRRKGKVSQRTSSDKAVTSHVIGTPVETGDGRRRKRQKDKRRSHSPFDEPKGAYRIPPQGQLQIIIKNPNKTAVKLFLVPYDVSDMQPGQKTFIRQRSYSAGPILDIPLDSRNNLGTDRPEASLSHSSDPQDRPVLRYLIHLHMCCTSQGRIWLYKSIRVVFANRVPDGKEKLRNETQLPEPKYSLYRPHRSSAVSTPLVKPQQDGSNLMDLDSPTFADPEAVISYAVRQHRSEAHSLPGTSIYDGLFTRRQPGPSFHFPVLETVTSRPSSRGLSDEQMDSDGSNHAEGVGQRVKSPKSPLSPLSQLSPLQQRAISPITDCSEGTGSFTFSRSSSAEKLPGVRAESLLSRRLKDLEMSRASSSGPSSKSSDG